MKINYSGCTDVYMDMLRYHEDSSFSCCTATATIP